ncbi:mod(mdg4) [Trypoxylus dichotomus]
MEGEQFSLCWNHFHSNLSSGFHTLLKDEVFVDVTLAAEGKYIKAHKIVLSVCSPYFEELFRVNPCKHPIVILQDVSYSALYNLLQFMYKGVVNVSQEEIQSFVKVAEILKVKGLTNNNTSTDTNRLDSDKNTCTSSLDSKQFLKGKFIKEIIKPIEPPQNIKCSPAKQACYEYSSAPTSNCLASVTVNTRHEPIDSQDDFQEQSYEDLNVDMASMLKTTLEESSDSKTSIYVPRRLPTTASCPDLPQLTEENKKRKRCCYCDPKKDRKTKYFCKSCGNYMCLEHCTYLCKKCFL